MDSKRKTLTLATYNIHSCIGTDGRYDPDRIIAVIKSLNADVVGLQEVTSHYSDDLNLLDYLGEQLGMRVIAGLTMFRETSGYGNALLVRGKTEQTEQINISYKKREPRGAVSLTMKTGGKRVHIISTHLGLSRYERRPQIKRIISAFSECPADISVLMGDLNEWYPWSEPLRQMRNYFSATHTPGTFPAQFPLLSLDRILVRPPGYIKSTAAVGNSLTRISSDHLPLTAMLGWRLD